MATKSTLPPISPDVFAQLVDHLATLLLADLNTTKVEGDSSDVLESEQDVESSQPQSRRQR
jgi:hypothetical protein